MDVVFFGASLPLTKTIVHHQGSFTVAPYPQVRNLTSFHARAGSLREFHDLLVAHAARGHCLFNGQLTQPLTHESREGKTKHGTEREWVVFDFDKVEADSPEDAIKRYLPSYCHNVSCIVQLSSGMFIPNPRFFSGHIFMRLSAPITQERLVQWFEWLNFHIPSLSASLTLTDSGQALHWPLDRTAAYDSKLIYISPPKCIGFTPTILGTDYLRILSRPRPSLTIPEFTPVARSTVSERINELRVQAGMQTREFKTRKFEDGEILLNAEPGTIHDVKPIGNHYIKFNLNGGDSYGYWMDLRNPAVIKNFKGEPYLLTKEVDESFYKAIVKQSGRIVAMPALDDGAEVLAFYATNRGGEIMTGIYTPGERNLRLDGSNLSAAAAWLAGYGVLRAGYFPHHDVVFDPHSDIQYAPGYPVINTFRATDYMLQQPTSEKPSSLADLPPLAYKTIKSMLGDENEELMRPFVNWLAYIFQTRKKTGMSYLLHGEEGTGKGSFVRFFLTPLFGDRMVRTVQFSLVQTQFNQFLEDALIVVFDEANLSAVENADDLMMKLYHWTTEPVIEIHSKGKNPYQRNSFCNFIYLSNERNPVRVKESQRRISVMNRQEQRLYYTPNEYIRLERFEEVPAFADVLKRWPVDEQAVRKVVETEAAARIHEQTTSINVLIAEAVRHGDVQFFLDRMPSDNEAQADFHNRWNPLSLYKDIFDKVIAGKKTVLTSEDLFIIFRTLIPDPRYFQDSKTWRMRHFNSLGLIPKMVWAKELGKSVYGIRSEWKLPTSLPDNLRPKATPQLKRVK